jgi:hypothetical protein
VLRYLPFIVELALLVYCLIDCIQTDSVLVRNLSKTTWVLLIIFVPIVGGVAWLVAGRPTRGQTSSSSVPWPATRTAGFPEYERPRPPRGPDDDPAFLADLHASDAEHEKMLAEWEATLRAREAELRTSAAPEPEPVEAAGGPGPDGSPSDDEDGDERRV